MSNPFTEALERAEIMISKRDAEIKKLRELLRNKQYLQMKADYNRGHLSYFNTLQGIEKGLGLEDG